jgi:hypothetical protein
MLLIPFWCQMLISHTEIHKDAVSEKRGSQILLKGWFMLVTNNYDSDRRVHCMLQCKTREVWKFSNRRLKNQHSNQDWKIFFFPLNLILKILLIHAYYIFIHDDWNDVTNLWKITVSARQITIMISVVETHLLRTTFDKFSMLLTWKFGYCGPQ